jgi:hypothetical protein
LPHVGAIDPRTGRKTNTLTGFVSPEDMLQRLTDISDRHRIVPLPRAPEKNPVANVSTTVDDGSTGPTSGDHTAAAMAPVAATAAILMPPSATAAAAAAAAAAAVGSAPDYGAVPAEPAAGTSSIVISLRFEGGKKALTRRYTNETTVRALYAVALEQKPAPAVGSNAAKALSFELTVRLPGAPPLYTQMDRPLSECNLDHAVVFMRWRPQELTAN